MKNLVEKIFHCKVIAYVQMPMCKIKNILKMKYYIMKYIIRIIMKRIRPKWVSRRKMIAKEFLLLSSLLAGHYSKILDKYMKSFNHVSVTSNAHANIRDPYNFSFSIFNFPTRFSEEEKFSIETSLPSWRYLYLFLYPNPNKLYTCTCLQ